MVETFTDADIFEINSLCSFWKI